MNSEAIDEEFFEFLTLLKQNLSEDEGHSGSSSQTFYEYSKPQIFVEKEPENNDDIGEKNKKIKNEDNTLYKLFEAAEEAEFNEDQECETEVMLYYIYTCMFNVQPPDI